MTNKGSMNHVRLCVSELAVSSAFYSVVLSYLGYHLVEKTNTLRGWARPGPGGNLQWVIVSQAEPGHRNNAYDRGSPGLQHIAFNAESRSDVEEFANHMRNNGIEPFLSPQEFGYERGYFATFVKDDDGIVIEYVHTPLNTLGNYRPDNTGSW